MARRKERVRDLERGDFFYLDDFHPLFVLDQKNDDYCAVTHLKYFNLTTGETKESEFYCSRNVEHLDTSKAREYILMDKDKDGYLSLYDPISGEVRDDLLFHEEVFDNSHVVDDSLETGRECIVKVVQSKKNRPDVIVSVEQSMGNPNIKRALRK